MIEDIRETRLETGTVVLTDRMPGVRSATLGFFFRCGARSEPAALNGITHFIEHCVFKGTGKRSALDIAVEQDRLGGTLDAFTTHEETGFVIKVIDDRLEAAFDLLSDMLGDPKFAEADLENEQRVIIEEMKMNEDSPEDLLGDIFHREFFRGHPLGLPITGTAETVRSFGNRETAAFHTSAFTPENLIIVAAGNVEHDLVVEMVDGHIGRRGLGASAVSCAEEPPTPRAPIFIEPRPDLEQTHLILAAPSVSGRDPRRYWVELLSSILGGGTSSRLWQNVRENHGLVYGIDSSAVMYNDCGHLSVSAAASPEHACTVLDMIVAELRNLVRNGVSAEELALVKEQARSGILLELEDSAARAGSLAQCELTHGRQIPVEETLERLDAVTLEEVHSAARDLFNTQQLAFVAIGSVPDVSIDRDRLAI
jgi:predicted Zn-dependent peptidase